MANKKTKQKLEPCDEYKPTMDELRQLARHWARVRLDLELDRFEYGIIASGDLRERVYAGTRLDEIARAIGEDKVQEAVDEVEREAARQMGPERWHAFRHGTRQDYEDASEDSFREFEYLQGKAEDHETRDRAWAYLVQNPSRFHLDAAADLWYLTGDYPRQEDGQESLLCLKVKTPGGALTILSGYTLARPAGWHAPYGL